MYNYAHDQPYHAYSQPSIKDQIWTPTITSDFRFRGNYFVHTNEFSESIKYSYPTLADQCTIIAAIGEIDVMLKLADHF